MNHPVVTDDFDGQCHAIDAAILAVAETHRFAAVFDTLPFEPYRKIPDLIYRLISVYSARGFNCVYDGEAGTLTIAWSYPATNYGELDKIKRAVPSMVPNLGIGYRAAMLYMCMTNGISLIEHTVDSLTRQVREQIKEAATLGNTEIQFGFPGVPAPVVMELFLPMFESLIADGFEIRYNVNTGLYVIVWGQTLRLTMTEGDTMEVGLDE